MPIFVDSHGREGDIPDEDVAAYGGEEELAKAGYTRAQTAGIVSRPAASSQASAPEPKVRLIDRRGYVTELTQREIDEYGKEELEKEFGPLRVAGEGSDGGLVGAYKTLAQIPYQVRTAAHYVDKAAGTNIEKTVAGALPATTPDDQRRMDNTLVTSAIGGLDGLAKFTGMQTAADVAAAAMAYGGASQAVRSLDKMLGTDAEGALRSASEAAAVPIAARGVQAAGVALQATRRPGTATVGVDDALLRVGNELGVDPAVDPEGFVNALQKRNPGTYAISQLAGGIAAAETAVGSQAATSQALSLSQAAQSAPIVPKILAWAAKPGIAQGAAKGAGVGGAYGFFQGVDEVAHKVQENPDQTASAVASTAFHDIGWGTVTGVGVGAATGAFGEILSRGSGWLRNRSLVNEGEAAANWATKEQSLRGEMAKIDKQISDIEIASGRRAIPGSIEQQEAATLQRQKLLAQKAELDKKIADAVAKGEEADVTGLVSVEERLAQPVPLDPMFNVQRPLTGQEQQIMARGAARSASLGKLADVASKRALEPTVNWSNVGRGALLRGGQFEAGNLAAEMLLNRGHMGFGAGVGAVIGGTGALIRDPMAVANAQRAVSTTLAGGAALMGSEGFIQRGLASFFSDKAIGKPVESTDDEAFNFFTSAAKTDPMTVVDYVRGRLAPFIGTDLARDSAVKIGSVYSYLKSVLPTPAPPDPWTSDPSGVPPIDSDEKRRYIENAEAAGDPAVATARLTQGLLTKHHISALEANHPETLRAIRESYLSKMVELVQKGDWKDVSQGQLQQLKVLFGADVDSPQQVRDLQAQFAAAKEADPLGGSSDKTAAAPSRYSGHAADTSKSGSDKVEEGP